MRRLISVLLLGLLGIAFGLAPAHAQPTYEASAADATAGTKGAPYYISPRRLKAITDAIVAGTGSLADPGGNGLVVRTALGTTTPRSFAEGLAIDITNGDGVAGNPTAAFDPTELTGSRTFGDGSTDTIVWTWNRATGTDPTLTFGDAAITLNGTFTATTLAGAGGGITLDASGFNGNLETTDDTLQEVAQKLDDLVASGSDDQTAAEVAVTPTGNLAADDVQEALGELQGDIDSLSAGTVADDSITAAKMADGDHGDFTYATNVASIDAGAVTAAKMAASLDLSGKTAVAVPTIAGSTDNDTSAASTAFVQAVAATKQDADADLTIAAGASAASNSTFFGKNASGTVGFHSVSGSGDVVGPASATDNAIARFDTTTGKLIQNSAVTIDDSGNMSGIAALTITGALSVGSLTFEGATADDYETSFAVVDPTADRTITFPNDTGTVALTGSSFSGSYGTPNTTTPLSPTWTRSVHTVVVGNAQTINLPAASGYAGRGLILLFSGSYVATVDPNASEIIYRAGAAQTGGVSVTCTGTAGQATSFQCDGTSWWVVSSTATVAEGS
jgi:hypothetical protein